MPKEILGSLLNEQHSSRLCPTTKNICDDECCPSFATEEQCNLGPNSDLLTDTKPENNID